MQNRHPERDSKQLHCQPLQHQEDPGQHDIAELEEDDRAQEEEDVCTQAELVAEEWLKAQTQIPKT